MPTSTGSQASGVVTRVQWDPAKHPRGAVGRFIPVVGTRSFSPRPDMREWQAGADAGGHMTQNHYQSAYRGPAGDELPPEQDDIVNDYTGSAWVNEVLRDGDDLDEADGGDVAETAAEYVRSMDDAIEQFQLVDDTSLWRGVDFDLWGDLQPGDQIVDRGFMSTSLNPEVASEFADDRMEIRVPAGTHALPASRFNSDYRYQLEFTLGRGAVLQVVEPPGEGDGRVNRRVMVVELVGYIDD